MPSNSEYDEAMDNLEKNNWKIDYIITHCAPTHIAKQISCYYESDKLTQFFDKVMQNNEFKYWYFGHYHADKYIGSKFLCVYNDIIKLGNIRDKED